MARSPRFDNQSESDFYHVTARGAGRRMLFEDDVDRARYHDALFRYIDETTGSIVAWCLMGNHVHLLFHLELHELSDLVHRLHTVYAQHFNGRHGHVGPVFQSRFDCEPIHSESHLAYTVRYIHRNPKDIPGQDWRSYPWSSYRGYTDGSSGCDTDIVLDLMGGADGFKRLHEQDFDVHFVRLDGYRRRLNDSEAKEIFTSRLGPQFVDKLASLPKVDRDHELAIAYNMGASIRQIERLTGIGRGIVQDATTRKKADDWLRNF